jgi:hypothetical protein
MKTVGRRGTASGPGRVEREQREEETMVTGRIAGPLLVAALAIGLGVGEAAAQEVERLAGTEVAVYNLAGRVDVVAGSGTEVVVRVRRGGSDGGRLTLERGRIEGRETLRVRYPGDEIVYPEMGRGSRSTVSVRADGTFSDGGRGGTERVTVQGSGDGLEAWADLTVEVPAGRSTEVYLAVGHAEARGVTGDVRLDTGSGEVRASGVEGRLIVDTGSGSVDVSDVRGEVLVDTGSGRIDVARVSGERVELDTGSGGVQATGVEARSLRIDTGSGMVRIEDVSSADVEIDTGSGGVELELRTDVERLVVDTGSGGVTVRVPDGLGAEIELETGSGRIQVDVPVSVRSAGRDSFRGRIGDGRGTVSIDTGSGGIRLLPAG